MQDILHNQQQEMMKFAGKGFEFGVINEPKFNNYFNGKEDN